MTCQHCNQPITTITLTNTIPYQQRHAHTSPSRAHGCRTMPTFITCHPTGHTTATPKDH